MRRPSILVEFVEDHVVVRPVGELDLAVTGELIEAYGQALAIQAEPHIVVDLSRVTFMDSTALGTLVAAVNRARSRGGTLSVVGASDRIATLFQITGLDIVVPLRQCSAAGPFDRPDLVEFGDEMLQRDV